MSAGSWTFLSNHGHVLVSLARHPDARTRDVAQLVGITERAVQQIVADLVDQGFLRKEKVGRRNHYEVAPDAHFRHDLESHVSVGDFLDLVVGRAGDHQAGGGHGRSTSTSSTPAS
ncbi:helix-turn-helix transcriptional regulator [Nocardioides sp.]|uniref:helix-turn-helix transcriptional regulator n=1 Tax=Nocardioides sp. TaxID=35761 RepID=UPI003784086D